MYSALRLAQDELRRFLDRCGRDAPQALLGVEIHTNPISREIEFRAEFPGGMWHPWSIPEHRLTDGYYYSVSGRTHDDFFDQLRSAYARLFENHLLHLDIVAVEERFSVWARECCDPEEIALQRRRLAEEVRHIRAHHGNHYAPAPVWVGFDTGSIAAGDVVTIEISPRGYLSPVAVEAEAHIDGELRGQLGREYARMQDRLWNQIGGSYNEPWFGRDVGAAEAQAKGEKLLRAWLSPEQLAQYDSHKHFEVIGSATGTRYRIRHGRQMNIDQLDAQGNKVCGWCFLPEGGLVAGDCMLAQKIALETDEASALETANQILIGAHEALMGAAPPTGLRRGRGRRPGAPRYAGLRATQIIADDYVT